MRIPGLKLPRFSMFQSAGVVARLALGFGLLLALLVGIGAVGWLATGSLARGAQGLVRVDHQRGTLVAAMERAVAEMALSTTSISLTEDAQDIQYEVQRLKRAIKAYDGSASTLETSQRADPDTRIAEQLVALRETRGAAVGLMEQIAQKATAGIARDVLADFVATQLRPPQDAWFKQLAALNTAVDARMQAAAAQSQALADKVQAGLAAASLLALSLGITAAVVISRSVTRPLGQAVGLARAVAQGDLTAETPTTRRDEFGVLLVALGEMQASLRRVVGDIGLATDSIHAASNDVAGGNADLSRRTDSTAAHLQQAAASMRQLNENLRNSVGATTSADGLASDAARAAKRGGEVVAQVVNNMESIADSSRRIAVITGVIDGIAFQTNLLALNAAVEAARAGTQGRGFAVVAGEVRTLAQRAAAAAKEIKSLIDISADKVATGNALVRGAGVAMGEIVGSIDRVTQAVAEIRDAAHQQSDDIIELTSAVEQVDSMTQQNSALVEQGSAAATLLAEQAVRMNALIGTFRLTAA